MTKNTSDNDNLKDFLIDENLEEVEKRIKSKEKKKEY